MKDAHREVAWCHWGGQTGPHPGLHFVRVQVSPKHPQPPPKPDTFIL